ncbi:MAG TPA: ATP-binding cassette domain-containing protein [Devosia sp.]|jgi:simple sugar transport system ATP-binding protein|uniref:ATP-binding cassette domain-containing protein n=1 Tax=Devosia sp. TaxID=1871048 RepID=UPI002DDCBB52|nr:ATP-binding cassette domain-containing protein [Devosia sp.]HEV2517862.1 ATP-binding cassette domain-containing protein [Devosia sp.]
MAAMLLEARGISKYFGAITALRDVNFHVAPGEVLGVVGDNGAGKSTLMKILSGLFTPSEGELVFNGAPVKFSSPKDAQKLGIEMVYQDFALAGNMAIYENIYLGREPGTKFGPLTVVDHKRARRMASDHLDRLHIHVKSVEQNTEDLSGGQRQAVAIARATAFDAKLVIMDEPTAALAIKEVGKVLDLVRSLKEHGVAVIIISHRMDDIFYCCDRVMALYQGTNFAEAELGKTSRNEVIGWIMGTKGHTATLAHDNMH